VTLFPFHYTQNIYTAVNEEKVLKLEETLKSGTLSSEKTSQI